MAGVPCMFLIIGKIMSWGCVYGDISNVHSRQYYYITNRIWRVQRDQANSPLLYFHGCFLKSPIHHPLLGTFQETKPSFQEEEEQQQK